MPTAVATGQDEERRGPWAAEADDLIRAASGGMLFGIPLLYTMEVWWIGTSTEPSRLFIVLGLMAVPVFFLNRTSGFRSTRDVTFGDALRDTVEAVAVGIVCVAALLVLLREITLSTPLGEALGKVVYEATPFSIGVSLAGHFLRRGRTEGDDDGASGTDEGDAGGEDKAGDEGLNATLADVGATIIGAIFVAFNIAPTDEVPMLAAAMPPVWLLALVAASLVISYSIVFEAGFSKEEQRRTQAGILQHPLTETVAAYLIALLTSATMLWFFQQIGADSPWELNLSHVLVLGLPAAVGGAAGRLAV